MKDSFYRAGYDAFGEQQDIDANPYSDDSEKGKSWEAGWEDAKIDEDLSRRSICHDHDS